MANNYQNLNWFDAATIIMIAAGLGLIGNITFNSLEPMQQQKISSALQIFDMHAQWQQTLEMTGFVLVEAPEEFMKEFHIAFEEILAVTPDEFPDLSVIPKGIMLVIDTIGSLQIPETGNVAGASVEEDAHTGPPMIFQLPKVDELKPNFLN